MALRIVPGVIELPDAMWPNSIIQVLTQTGHIERSVAARRPPVLALLKTILAAPGNMVRRSEVREQVETMTQDYCRQVTRGGLLGRDDQCRIYRRLLAAAWQSDLALDHSETALLGLLRKELSMTQVEHFVMMHHEDIQPFWQDDSPFDTVVDALLDDGAIFSFEDMLVLPRELIAHVRKAIGIPLDDKDTRRLYPFVANKDLKASCARLGLKVTGSKNERIERLIFNFAPASLVLDALHIHDLRDIARKVRCRVTGSKLELVDRLLSHFAHGNDITLTEPEPAPEPEQRELDNVQLGQLLSLMTGFQLRQILSRFDLPETGSKTKQAETLCASIYSEKTLLRVLKNEDLVKLLARRGMETSGSKGDKIERLVAGYRANIQQNPPSDAI